MAYARHVLFMNYEDVIDVDTSSRTMETLYITIRLIFSSQNIKG